MRILRQSAFASPDMPPVTTMIRESDAPDTLESVRERMLAPDLLVVSDIFETEDLVTEVEMVAEGMARIDAERESNMAVLYFHDLEALRITKPGGLLTTNRPAPLSEDQIRVVLDQLARHPNYEGQTVVVHDENMKPVTLKKGKLDG